MLYQKLLIGYGTTFSITLEANCMTDEDMSKKFMRHISCTFYKYNPLGQRISASWLQEICISGKGDCGHNLYLTVMPEIL